LKKIKNITSDMFLKILQALELSAKGDGAELLTNSFKA